MSPELLSRSPDLKRLRDEGYFVQMRGGFLVLREVPYVNQQGHVRKGKLISSLVLAGDRTQKPDTHVIHFDGSLPCQADGKPIQGIVNQSSLTDLGHGLRSQHRFSSKPEGGYPDYYQKMTSYASILSGPAAVVNPEATPRVFRSPEEEDQSVFNYLETASDRVGIGSLAARLADERVAIVGLGGTGSYVLDLVAKTPVREIRLFDPDEYLQHNAFRSPGAPSLDTLREIPMKVDYFKGLYGRMHRKIVAHPVALDSTNVNLLEGISFAFLCLDSESAKRPIVEKLEAIDACLVDSGMGLELNEGSLGGILRVTVSTPSKRDHFQQRVSFAGGVEDDVYSSNIQVADLNALNANLAVLKWKKLRGFYRDLEREHHCTYTTDGNMLLNGDLDNAA